MSKVKTIKVDIDGVLRNILPTMCDLYNNAFKTSLQPSDIVDYNVSDAFPFIEYDLGMTAVDYFFNINGKEVFRYSKPYDGAIEGINKLHNLGYKITIVSSQATVNNKIDTLLWLRDNDVYYDDICFTSDKDIVKGDYMIDDYPKNLFNITGNCQCVLIDAPYNKTCNNFTRFQSFIDFVNSLA
jgi:5'(3')-deoxyribonucleotidase